MGFDHRGFPAQAALYYIRIYGSLHKKIYRPDLLGLFLKYTDKFFSYNLPFLFRLDSSCKLAIESFLRINPDKVQVIMPFRSKDSLYFVPFIFP